MNPLERLEIHLENSHEGTYMTGQTVPGKLVITLRRSLKIQGIEIKVRGRGHAQWNEGEGDIEQLLFETEEYIQQSIMIVGKAPDKTSPPHIEFLDSGQNTYQFNFTIPESIPSSFEGLHGYIRYWVKAKIYGVWGLLDQSGKVEFGVQRPLDLRTVPGAMLLLSVLKSPKLYIRDWVNTREPAEDEDSCILCGCCLNDGYVQALLRINKRGFTPGESIICNAEVYNGSDSSLKSSKVKFYRVVTYGDAPFESNTIEKKTLCEQIRGKVKPGQSEIYDDTALMLPQALPVTSLPGCPFIDVDYVVELKVISSVEEYNLRIPLLVIVGTSPFDKLTNQNTDGVVNSEAENQEIPGDDKYQPFTTDPVIADAGKLITTPTISVAPRGTELQVLYPPMNNLSILEREKTLNDIYRKRRRAVRFMGTFNEGFDDEEDFKNDVSRPTSNFSRTASNLSRVHSNLSRPTSNLDRPKSSLLRPLSSLSNTKDRTTSELSGDTIRSTQVTALGDFGGTGTLYGDTSV